MKAIITGDIVNSATFPAAQWMPLLKKFLYRQGESPASWEIFRGDSFQFLCEAPQSFFECLLLKSVIKQQPELDVRISIGIGAIDYQAKKISESNGSAFVRSGRTFDKMPEKQYLAVTTGDVAKDDALNLLMRFASVIMDNWSPTSAQTVEMVLTHTQWNQQQIADKLGINQSAVSQNRKRAQIDLLLDLNDYFRTTISTLTS